MKFKVLFLLTITSLISFSINAQRGVRIGYIDTEYILQNVPEYKEASGQLDKKVLQWKSEIEQRLNVIEQKKKELDNERVLLTKELYEERLEDITFEESEVLDYQQKRFGPNGDLIIQKKQLMQPIQDQIFTAVQQIATTGKYDFVFDKSADVVMLYSAERYDISERVLKTITRTSKRKQATNKKERKALEDEELIPEVSKEKDERAKALEDKKAAKDKELEDKRAARKKAQEDRKKQQQELREARKREAEARRQKAIDARNKAKAEREGKTVEQPKDSVATPTMEKKASDTSAKTEENSATTDGKKVVKKTSAQILEEKRQQKIKDREARKKALEDRKKKIIEDRKKAREERLNKAKKNDSIAKSKDKGQKEGENNNN